MENKTVEEIEKIINDGDNASLMGGSFCDIHEGEIYEKVLPYAKEIQKLREDNEWVKVADRKPEEGQEVLCLRATSTFNIYVICTYTKGSFRTSDMTSKLLITHWKKINKPEDK
jgi:hypothetical protein